MKYRRACLALFLTLLVLTSCSDLRGPAEERAHQAEKAESNDPIIIGAAAPWETLADLGYYHEGLELALQEINQEKVLGRKIELLWKDDQGSVSQGRAVAQDLADNPNVMAVLGHYQSSISLPVSLIYQHYGLLMMTATSTTNELTDREGLDLVFRNIPNDQQIASQLASFCQDQGYERVIVFNEDNEFGNSLANAFENRAGEIDLNVVDRSSYDFSTGRSQFRRIISDWKDFYQFDAIFLAGVVPKAAEFIVQAREMGVEVPIVGGDGLDSPQLWEIGGDLVNGTIVGTYFHHEQPGEKVQSFVKAFEVKYGVKPDPWAAQAYDTLHVLARAMRKAGTTNPVKVAKTLRNMDDYEGLLGNTEFNARGDLVDRSITTKIVKDRQFEYLGLQNKKDGS
ncbi:MAG: ABC transporter substrate-binding protein [Desulfohalobiaceae bacterium]